MVEIIRPLSIALIATDPARHWQTKLAGTLRAAGHRIAQSLEPSAPGKRYRGIELLLELERFAYGARSQAFARVDPPGSATLADADVTIELRDRPNTDDESPRLVPLFDGAPGEAALIAALLEGRAPEIAIVLWGAEPRIVARGIPALEDKGVLARGLDQVLARVADLLVACIGMIARGEQLTGTPISSVQARYPSLASFATRNLAAKVASRLTRLSTRADHWSIAFRQGGDDTVMALGRWPQTAWTRVPDDRNRFFADPVPVVEGDRTYVFCEEYPYATGKGIISLFEIRDGVPTSPRPVLERPYHLSYPFVFRRGPEIYMIPETGAAARIELYRADPFPDRWVFERVLVDNVVASDATLVTWQGRDWLFASIATGGASTWDALGLFHADDLFGDWQPHPLNPVLIDAGAARPGGAMVAEGGRLRRVAQDCRARYGGGLVLADVERLDPEGYVQSVRSVLGPPPGSGALGAHTLNAVEGTEVIDLVENLSRGDQSGSSPPARNPPSAAST